MRKRRTLDAIEGEGGNYSRDTINLRDKNGQAVHGSVFTYIGRDRKAGIRTSSEYVSFILQGHAEHRAIPIEYVEYVRARALANNPGLQLSLTLIFQIAR
jgi:hypothetical protein